MTNTSMRTRGFTLVEVLVSLAILSFVITTSIAVFFERERRMLRAEQSIRAYSALSNEIELRRHVSYDGLEAGSSEPFLTDTTLLDGFRDLTTSVVIEQIEPDLKKLTLKLAWNAGKQRAELTMLRSNTGGSNLW